MAYVDGFLLAVPQASVEAYREIAENAGRVWMDHGALSYVEAIADDLPEREGRTWQEALALKPGEMAFYSFITYRDRAHRDEVNAKVMADPRIAEGPQTMPFDMTRMLYGGFRPIVHFGQGA